MSAGKKRAPGNTFHIQYPARKDFLTWVEVGCLARSLGFPPDLIRSHVNEEVECDEEGIGVQQVLKMIELKLIHQPLHRSFNMHTADWNMCVIKKAMKFLQLNVLSFEELHSIRVAYTTYEAGDMKGLNLDKRTLLRTLKMCQRVISPKKLMHRVKHMRSKLEEANRIQLYEFFELILWCDVLENQSHVEHVREEDGKDNNVYHLVDFGTLLSHQDQRQSRALDQRYLAEEWDFGREQFGGKQMFKGEVVYTDQRERQTQTQTRKYRHLKRAVGQSQRSVYRALAGSIRARPISAPILSMYASPRGTPRGRSTSAAAVYKDVQRRLHSAPSGSKLDVSDRPVIPEYVRVNTPSVITSNDLEDVTIKMENLEFAITTLGSRSQVKLEDERNFYIPDYVPSVKEESTDGAVREAKPKEEHWTPEIIDNLAYPPHHRPYHHALACDARFRGWKPSTHKGHQKILTVPTFETSPHGLLLAKQRAVMLAPVRNMHKDYVVRYTSKGEAGEQRRAQRPCTAPSPRTPRTVKRIGCRSAGAPRNYVEEDLEGEEDNDSAQGRDFSKTMDSEDQGESSYRPTSFPDPMGKYAKDGFRETDSGGGQGQTGTDTARSVAGSSSLVNSGRIGGEEDISAAAALASSAAAGSSTRPNRSKMVEVGLMGTIELLESIQEHDAEDGLSEVSTYSSSSLTEHERRLLQRNSARKVRLQLEDPAPLSTAVGQGNHAKPLLDDGERKSKIDLQATQQDTRSKDNKLSNEKGINAGRTYDKAEPTTGKLPPASHLGKNIGPATTDLKTSTRLGQPTPETMFPLLAAMQNHSSSSQARVIVEKPEDTIGDRQRAESVASSTITDTSDEREVPTPLTSITVTIKNRDQHVTSSTRRADDVDHTTNNDDNGAQSPSSFRSSRPCVTSTPRQRKPLSNTRTTVGNTSRPGSGNRERTKSAADLPTSNTDSRMGWVQDQILAMNSAYETREDEKTKECGPTLQEDGDQEDVDTILAGNEGRKKSIHFCPDTRESNAQLILKRLSSTERLLRPKKFDLNAEAPRRYIFNKATTRRLLERVHGVISPEMRSRIKKGDTGLKVI